MDSKGIIELLNKTFTYTDCLGRPHLVFPEDMDETDVEIVIESLIEKLMWVQKQNT